MMAEGRGGDEQGHGLHEAGVRGTGRMRIAIAGANGFLGESLAAGLRAEGHEVTPVVRHRRSMDGPVVEWDPAASRIDAGGLEGMDAVVNLAGESITGLWTAAKKRRIRQSRLRSTAFLAERLARLKRPPGILLSASGVNYYGAHDPAETVAEDAPAGRGFLAGMARDWEAATAPAEKAGIRVVHMRMGMVVGHGGAIGVMLPIFRLGLGGPVGSGDQIVSWIARDEIAPALLHVIRTPSLRGPVNFTSPEAVSFTELTDALASALHRPAFFRLPAFAARLVLGQMAEETLLTGARVRPAKLLESGYVFRYPGIDEAMRRAVS